MTYQTLTNRYLKRQKIASTLDITPDVSIALTRTKQPSIKASKGIGKHIFPQHGTITKGIM